jgi:hypothetical protein
MPLVYPLSPFLKLVILSAGFGLGNRGRGLCGLLDGRCDPEGIC